jgi:hypothetical protein
VLGVTALVLAAVAAAFKADSLNAWVPVVTTIGTSVAAYIAAARYDHMVIEFLRTAQRLESLCHERRDKPDGDPAQGSGVFRTYGGLSGMHGCGTESHSCEHGHAT